MLEMAGYGLTWWCSQAEVCSYGVRTRRPRNSSESYSRTETSTPTSGGGARSTLCPPPLRFSSAILWPKLYAANAAIAAANILSPMATSCLSAITVLRGAGSKTPIRNFCQPTSNLDTFGNLSPRSGWGGLIPVCFRFDFLAFAYFEASLVDGGGYRKNSAVTKPFKSCSITS